MNVLIDYLPLFKAISAIFSAVLLVVVVYLGYKIQYLNENIERWMDSLMVGNLPQRRAIKVWHFILSHLQSKRPEDWKEALKKADGVLDEILKISGYPGDNLDERLEDITAAQISNVENIRHAHILTNKIRKEPDLALEKHTIEEALYAYREAFRELRLLE
ncbi:MAG: hypothetical protein ABH822_02370 [Patescibacteria group bacterium]